MSLSDLSDLVETVWGRATAQQPVPPPGQVLAVAVLALLLVAMPVTWPRVRLGVTVVHEAGHAAVAVLVGRRLSGIRLERDTSGVTVSRGRRSGPGLVAMLAAGYLMPGLVGLAAALLLASGHAVGLLWTMVVVVLALLVWVRNLYGLLVLLLGGGVVVALTWWGTPTVQSTAAHLVVWVLLLAAPRPVLELLRGWRRRQRTSDPDQLAAATGVPALLWAGALVLVELATLVGGIAVLLPGVVAR